MAFFIQVISSIDRDFDFDFSFQSPSCYYAVISFSFQVISYVHNILLFLFKTLLTFRKYFSLLHQLLSTWSGLKPEDSNWYDSAVLKDPTLNQIIH